MSDAEERLKTVTAGEDWSLVGAEEFRLAADTLAKAVHELTVNSSLTGKAATAAESAATELSTRLRDVVSSISEMEGIVREANEYRGTLRKELDDLPGTPGWLVTAVRTAEAGTVIQSGGLSVVAGEGALALVHSFFGDKRDDEAKAKAAAARTKLDELAQRMMDARPKSDRGDSPGDTGSDDTGDGTNSGDGTGGDGGGGRYPYRLRVGEPPVTTVDPPVTGGPFPVPPAEPRPPVVRPPVVIDDPIVGPPFVERPWPGWPDPTTPDSGHHDPGSTTLPGGGGGGAGAGGGLSGSSAARGLSGAVLGGSSLAGAGLASRFGAGGSGGFGSGVGSGVGSGAAGGAAGGLAGSGRGLAGAGAAESAGGSAAGRGGAGMMAGGAGGRGEQKDSRRRGLGGIVAPTLDDDPDAVPLPPSAGSGSR